MTNFLIYPAVDIKDGKCVRLTHGKENHMTIYEDDPIKQVNFFSKNGFKWVQDGLKWALWVQNVLK